MSKKDTLKPVAAAIGAALVGTLSAGVVSAAENPFGLQQLDSGYMQLAASDTEGKCGGAMPAEGKCGGAMPAEGKCGGGMAAEGADETATEVAGDAAAEGATAEGSGEKATEGKCGEGKCGGKK
jgi:uncharacterized low-complexity protein